MAKNNNEVKVEIEVRNGRTNAERIMQYINRTKDLKGKKEANAND